LINAKINFSDIGHVLADKIKRLTSELAATVVELPNKIRATVIGAGAYSLSISGCSGFRDDQVSFPLRNVPVIPVAWRELVFEMDGNGRERINRIAYELCVFEAFSGILLCKAIWCMESESVNRMVRPIWRPGDHDLLARGKRRRLYLLTAQKLLIFRSRGNDSGRDAPLHRNGSGNAICRHAWSKLCGFFYLPLMAMIPLPLPS